eukprot:TRINITY_DN3957_c0_g1_i1.p1 TRINITY_DN3957_c0_g1~~TRINITY_DN3957_c0_g1_i1.p1  ORF type:complete len:148 (+),score=31.01 TRINITY_DN3957_c0_g1_i1:29-445(+)
MGSAKIRPGSPGEEAALLDHLRKMRLTPRQLEETGQLLDLLLMRLVHEPLALKLQQCVQSFCLKYEAAMEEAEKLQVVETRPTPPSLEQTSRAVIGTGGEPRDHNNASRKPGGGVSDVGGSGGQSGDERRWKLAILST